MDTTAKTVAYSDVFLEQSINPQLPCSPAVLQSCIVDDGRTELQHGASCSTTAKLEAIESTWRRSLLPGASFLERDSLHLMADACCCVVRAWSDIHDVLGDDSCLYE